MIKEIFWYFFIDILLKTTALFASYYYMNKGKRLIRLWKSGSRRSNLWMPENGTLKLKAENT